MDVQALMKRAKHIAVKKAMMPGAATAMPAAAPKAPIAPAATPAAPAAPAAPAVVPGPMGAKVAYVTKDGEPLFTIDQALEVFSKAASIIAEDGAKSKTEKAAYEESVQRVHELMKAAQAANSDK